MNCVRSVTESILRGWVGDMADLKRRLERLEGPGRRLGGVYVVRTTAEEAQARADAAALGDRVPVIIWRHTPSLG
jgi:hypothetical protein